MDGVCDYRQAAEARDDDLLTYGLHSIPSDTNEHWCVDIATVWGVCT